jgi:hypothetical protein
MMNYKKYNSKEKMNIVNLGTFFSLENVNRNESRNNKRII